MKHAQKADKFSLDRLLGKLKEGSFVIPDFQREFEWNPWDVRELIKSIFLDYYIGTLLLWKSKDENLVSLSCEPIFGHSGESRPEFIALDGQQRLTALYYACTAPDIPFPKRKNPFHFYVKIQEFINGSHDEAFEYYQYTKDWQKILAANELQYEQHVFPLRMLGADTWDMSDWVRGYEVYWTDKEKTFKEAGDLEASEEAGRFVHGAGEFSTVLKELTRDYQISYIELDQDIGVEKVCDIFTQINSRGVRLDIFDLLNAMLKPKGLGLKTLWRNASARTAFAEFDKMNVYVLQVMSILKQSYCSPKYLYFLLPGQAKPIRRPDGSADEVVLIENSEDFLSSWNIAVEALEKTVGVLRNPRDYGAISATFLPYPSILPAFAAISTHAQTLSKRGGIDIQRKIRKWYWASIFTNRYSSSAESTSAKDFNDLRLWFEEDEKEPQLISEFSETFQRLDLRAERKKGSAIYKAIFNLLVIRGAKDWFNLDLPEHEELDDHHIVPKSWGKKHVIPEIDSILNRTPLTPHTNRAIIQDHLPNVYLAELFAHNDEESVRGVLASHFISEEATTILLRKEFGPADFQEFLNERRRTIMEGIQSLLVKERIDMEPALRDLDAAIEQVELAVRREIVEVFGESQEGFPHHILVKAKERVQNMLRKDASKNPSDFETTSEILEFFDLQECKDLMTGKASWAKFETKFRNKGELLNRFNQLAELRNRLRHSRSVDVVAQRDGEAAIYWFQQVLGLPN